MKRVPLSSSMKSLINQLGKGQHSKMKTSKLSLMRVTNEKESTIVTLTYMAKVKHVTGCNFGIILNFFSLHFTCHRNTTEEQGKTDTKPVTVKGEYRN